MTRGGVARAEKKIVLVLQAPKGMDYALQMAIEARYCDIFVGTSEIAVPLRVLTSAIKSDFSG